MLVLPVNTMTVGGYFTFDNFGVNNHFVKPFPDSPAVHPCVVPLTQFVFDQCYDEWSPQRYQAVSLWCGSIPTLVVSDAQET